MESWLFTLRCSDRCYSPARSGRLTPNPVGLSRPRLENWCTFWGCWMSGSAEWMLEAVDHIYEAALHPAHWQKAVELLARHFGGGATIFFPHLLATNAM